MNNTELIEMAAKVFDSEIESMIKVRDSLDENFADAALKISNAKKVILSGTGKSGYIARKIAATLSSVGIPSYFLNPVEALHGDIGIVEPDDVMILISKSGSTTDLVTLVPYLRSRSAFIISITGNGKSYLSNKADINISAYVENEADTLNVVPTNSTTVTLALGDALAVCAMKLRETTLSDFSKQHPLGQLGRNILLQVRDVMHKDERLPVTLIGSSFRDVIIEITDKGLGCTCIIETNNKLTGIITDGDVRRALQKYDDIRNLKAENIMTSSPVSVSPETYLGEALSLMENRKSQISVLPVVDNTGNCVGVIRIHDIVRTEL
jgi:arabinose-5-phosphate isomerase